MNDAKQLLIILLVVVSVTVAVMIGGTIGTLLALRGI